MSFDPATLESALALEKQVQESDRELLRLTKKHEKLEKKFSREVEALFATATEEDIPALCALLASAALPKSAEASFELLLHFREFLQKYTCLWFTPADEGFSGRVTLLPSPATPWKLTAAARVLPAVLTICHTSSATLGALRISREAPESWRLWTRSGELIGAYLTPEAAVKAAAARTSALPSLV